MPAAPRLARRQVAGQLGAGAEAELGVDPREVRLDRLDRHEARGCDLFVRAALRNEGRHAALGRRQVTLRRRTAADAGKLSACLLGPKSGAELLEDPERGPESLSGRALAPRASSSRAEREKRTGTLERDRYALVLGERLLERAERAFEIALCRREEAAAAARTRKSGRPVELPRAALESIEKRFGLDQAAEVDQRFDLVRVRSARNRARWTPPSSRRSPSGPRMRSVASGRSSESSSTPSAEEARIVRDHHAALLGNPERRLRVGPSAVHLSPARAYERPHAQSEESLRLLAGLEGDLVCFVGAPARFSPATGEELDQGELGEDPRQRALLGTFVRALAQGAKDRPGSVQVVHPHEDCRKTERRAGAKPYRLDRRFELDPALEGDPPLTPAEQRVDHPLEGEPLHLRRLIADPLGEGDCRARMAGGGREVRSHEEERIREPGLELGPNG